MRPRLLVLFLFLSAVAVSHAQLLSPAPPDRIYGQLFTDVQMQKIFPDGKTFVDCVPKRNVADIMYDYGMQKGPSFDLQKFVSENFIIPGKATGGYVTDSTQDIVAHIKTLWSVLKRKADTVTPGSSLLPLPNPYIVPGGRFREVYYWDSYFTMLGLKESGESDLIYDMVSNFAFLIEHYGHIPNGNRTYYLGRSQPPFFSCMVELLAGIRGDSIYNRFLPAMEKEYAFFMDGQEKVKPGQAFRRVVKLREGIILNRYYDDSARPRQESYREDVMTAESSGRNKEEMYRHLRAAAESGIDFGSRWFGDNKTLATIETTDILPVDLNALMYHLEVTIARARKITGDETGARVMESIAALRRTRILKIFWNEKQHYFTDYDFKTGQQRSNITPAGMYPFCFINGIDSYMTDLGKKAGTVVGSKLLQPGGFSSSVYSSGEQWDNPNGWAPLEWMMIWGLDRCGQKALAATAARRWIDLTVSVYKTTGKLMEKYNVADITKPAGGGEYDGQDGFGWTNGVLLKLASMYGLDKR